MDRGSFSASGACYGYLGRVPAAGSCLFLHCWNAGLSASDGIVFSAVEAACEGLPILSSPSMHLKTIADACLLLDNPLYVALAYEKGLSFSPFDHDVFATSGGFIHPSSRESPYVDICKLVLSFSKVVLVAGVADTRLAGAALDRGIDVLLLRSSLVHGTNRDLAASGCPVVSSLSDAMLLPKCICYRTRRDGLRIGGSRYGVFNF